jgi:hypothetical protein
MTAQPGLWAQRSDTEGFGTPLGARLALGGMLQRDGVINARTGILQGPGNPLQVTGRADRNVDVAAGVAVTEYSAEGTPYIVPNDGTIQVPLPDPPVGANRIDTVCIFFVDVKKGAAATNVGFEVLQGTSGSGLAKATPDGYLALADIVRTPSVTASNQMQITNRAQFTTVSGGVLKIKDTTDRSKTTVVEGDVHYRLDRRRVYVNDGSMDRGLAFSNDAQLQFASAALRDAYYGSPTATADRMALQGTSVFRLDKMWVETYYAAYDVNNNPLGARVAGWYPTSPNAIVGRTARTGAGAQIGSGAFNNLNQLAYHVGVEARNISPYAEGDGWTVPLDGKYRLEFAVGVTGANVYAGVTVNTTNYSAATFVHQNAGVLLANESTASGSKLITLLAGDKVRLSAITSANAPWTTTSSRTFLNLIYEGVWSGV